MAGMTPDIRVYRQAACGSAISQTEPCNGREARGVGDEKAVERRHEKAADRRKRLRVADHLFAAPGIVEKFRKPRHGCDEFHADADEDAAPQNKKHLHRSGESGQERGNRVKQDAVGQDPAASKHIRQVAAQHSDDAAGKCGNVEKPPNPHLEHRRSRRGAPVNSSSAGRTISGSIRIS